MWFVRYASAKTDGHAYHNIMYGPRPRLLLRNLIRDRRTVVPACPIMRRRRLRMAVSVVHPIEHVGALYQNHT